MRVLPYLASCLIVSVIASQGAFGEPIKKDEIDYQNSAFKQWYGTTLIWRFERLPKKGAIPEHRKPYSGAIYADREGGTVNVLHKYDLAFNNGEEKAVQFEWRDIALRGTTSWAGHCNGWTAAAIRHAEPENSVTRGDMTFSPADIKALLAELYVYSDTEFLGGIDVAINPGTLHVVLANWLGLGRHPIGVETSLGREVWNYPAYEFTSESVAHQDNVVEVRTTLRCMDFLPYEVDKAPKDRLKDLHFHYLLTLNEDGEIVDGTYLYDSYQIDMLWAPMRPTQGGTEGNEDGNPHIDHETIISLWRDSVPEAKRTSWYVVDPIPEDAVLVSDWFQVSPDANDARLEYIPDLTRDRAASLLAARAPVRTPTPEADAPENTDAASPSTGSRRNRPNTENAPAKADANVDGQDNKEIFQERFADGSRKIEREVVLDDEFNYVNHGMYRQWSENGNLITEGEYSQGKRIGTWQRAVARNGNALLDREPFKSFADPFVSVATFREGKLHGTWTIQDAEERTAMKIEFVDGLRHGSFYYYHADGTVLREVAFDAGLPHGFFREYDVEGELLEEREYVHGQFWHVDRESFVSTTKKSQSGLLDPPLVMKSVDNWWNLKLAVYTEETGEPRRQGKQTVWYENGQTRFDGQFEKDQATGRFEWWYENGQLSRTGIYIDGKQHGEWTWWHANGTKAVQGAYQHGLPAGRWLFWKPNGELDERKELPADGQPVEPETPAEPVAEEDGGNGAETEAAPANRSARILKSGIRPSGY